jgi:5-(carboxyamino)imidazole ribonucleotide mutase
MKVAIIMGSDSDWPILEPAVTQLDQFGIKTEVLVASAHRTPDKVHKFVAGAQERGVKVIIAAAGAAAHLPGVIASFTTLPVIGIPVTAMAINGAKNAALFAAQILAVHDAELTNKLAAHRQDMADEVEKKDARLAEKISAKNS